MFESNSTMTPGSHSYNEINYVVNVNKEDCTNNQTITQYQIPTIFLCFFCKTWLNSALNSQKLL